MGYTNFLLHISLTQKLSTIYSTRLYLPELSGNPLVFRERKCQTGSRFGCDLDESKYNLLWGWVSLKADGGTVNEKKNKTISGVVLSNRMDKTVTVRLERTHRHPVFGKVIKTWSKVYAHDEENRCEEGDKVRLIGVKPLSKLKRWQVLEIVKEDK